MSQIIHCESRLAHCNLKIMKKVIEATQKKFGGKGLLKGKTVSGYFQSAKADLVFQFEGMRFPMGISISKEKGIKFVGDPWGSENWNTVKETIEQNYILINAALVMQQMGFKTKSQTLNNPEGKIVEGCRA